MKKRILQSALVATCALGLSIPAFAQTSGSSGMGITRHQEKMARESQGMSSLKPPDSPKALLQTLHDSNQREINLAHLASQKAQSPEAKQVAQQIQQDHQRLDQQVSQLASQMKVQLTKPPLSGEAEKRLDELQKTTERTLSALTGRDFDTLYLSTMVAEHDRDVLMLQQAQKSMQGNAQVSQLITQTLPVLEQHRQQSYDALGRLLQSEAGVGGGGAKAKAHKGMETGAGGGMDSGTQR